MNIVRSDQPLFTPVRMGELQLRNRIVMAPLTRMRASNPEHAPTQLHAEYYAQGASAGLIIGECTEISPDAYGWADTPGLWSAEQVRGWRRVTGYTDYPAMLRSPSYEGSPKRTRRQTELLPS